MQLTIFSYGIAVGAVALGVFAMLLRGRLLLLQAERDRLAAESAQLRADAARLQSERDAARHATADAEKQLAAHAAESTARLDAERTRFADQETRTKQHVADLEKLRATMQTEFQAVAAKLLDEKSKKFTDQNKEQVDALLHPLRLQIKEFRERVDSVYKGDTEDRAALKTQIEQLRQLNVHITEEATALTRALKGQSQARGAWGELVLERLLDSAGLIKGENYLVQESIQTEDGRRLRPDILLRLPDERHLVIDSKVSLIAYERAVNSPDDDAKTAATAEHVRAVRTHVEQLSAKQYEDTGRLVTPDYVFMFVPLDHAFSLALQSDSALYEWAFDRRVILVTAPSLLVTLKTVALVWKQDRQTRNVQAIADRGGALYDKFVGLISDLETVGRQLASAKSSYDGAMNKLSSGRGNLLNQVEDLKRLGAKAKKALPAPETE